MATSDIWTRSRGDMAADNRRLYDVAARAATLVDRYSWNDDVQRHFGAEPVALAMPFGLMDLQNDWRALFEALIVAGIVEPDHLGLPAEAGDAVFLRIQEYRAAGGYWYTCGQFEVVPGALSYAQCDAAAVEIYYRDPARAVRVVRDVLPVAARAEYLGGDRTRVNHSAVLGMIQGGSVVELSTGYAVIGDASANPDGAVLGSAFWPARIVLQGVPGPKGDPGAAGGVQVVGATFGARVGGTGGAWAEIGPYVEGVGYLMRKKGAGGSNDSEQEFETVSAAIAAAVLWLVSRAADGRLYFARFDGDVGSWELECFEGGCTMLNGEVTGYGVPVVNASGLHFTSVGLAGAAGDAWINAGAAGGGTDGYSFTVDPVEPGVGAVLHLFIDGVESQANTGLNFDTVGAAIFAGLKWLRDRGADAAVWWADYDPSQEGQDKWVIHTYENGVTVDGNGEVVTPGVEAPDFGGNVFDLLEAGGYVQPFLDANINAGFGPVPEWVQAIYGFELVQFGEPVWPALPGYPGGDGVSVVVQLPDGSFVDDGLNMRKVLGDLPGDPAEAVIAAVSMAGAAGVYGVVDDFSGELVATFLPNGPRAWAASAEGGGWVLVDSTGQGAYASGGGRYWVKDWHGFRGEWIKAHAVGVGVELSDSLMQVSATVITPGVGSVVYEARPALLATDRGTVFPEMPWVANGSTWANVTGAAWAVLDHPEWGDGAAETDESTAWAAAWYVAGLCYPNDRNVLRVFPQWKPEIPA